MTIDCDGNRQWVGFRQFRFNVWWLSVLLVSVTLICMPDSSYACSPPRVTTYLKKLGFDPSSKEITSIANDNVNGITLKSLVSRRDETGVRRFIATRNFIHKYTKDTTTAFPPATLYDVQYLTPRDQKFIMIQIQKAFGVPPKNQASLK